LYWVHVEHFPMHLHALPIQKLEEIIMIFSHGLCGELFKLRVGMRFSPLYSQIR
jgi:hypothetical protein